MNIQNSRILTKRSTTGGVVPTIPASDDHTDGSWLTTDIYKGELFINLVDGIVYSRDNNGIIIIRKKEIYWNGIINYYGDSIVEGFNSSDDAHSFSGVLSNMIGKSKNNYGVSGYSIRNVMEDFFTNTPFANQTNPTLVQVGINDLINSNNAYKIPKISEGIRAFIANHFLTYYIPGASDLITQAGSGWTNAGMNSATVCSKSFNSGAGTAIYSNVSGATLTFKHYHDNLVIGCFGIDAFYDYGRFTVHVDGVLKATYDPNGKGDDWYNPSYTAFTSNNPNVVCISGLNTLEKTVVITLLDNKYSIIDYVGALGKPEVVSPVIVNHIAKLNATGYLIAPAYASDANIEDTNEAIDAVCQYFIDLDYPVYVGVIEDTFDITDCLDTDGLHWNDEGHKRVGIYDFQLTKLIKLK